jgi:hypothetical protein
MSNILSVDLDWAIHHDKCVELIDFCVDIIPKVKEVYFIENHGSAFHLIQKNDVLYNVDHHHDLGYYNTALEMIQNGKCGEGNWVLALIEKNIIDKYIWIANLNSNFKSEIATKVVKHLKIFKKHYDLKEISNVDFKSLIICESMDYNENTPHQYLLLQKISKRLNKNTIIVNQQNSWAEVSV